MPDGWFMAGGGGCFENGGKDAIQRVYAEILFATFDFADIVNGAVKAVGKCRLRQAEALALLTDNGPELASE